MNRLLIGFTGMCTALLLSFCRDAGDSIRDLTTSTKEGSAFSPDLLRHTTLTSDIRAVVARRCSELEKLLKSPDIVEFTKRLPARNVALSGDEIRKFDQDWATAQPNDELLSKVSDNQCSKHLLTFQHDNPVFAEIFITDTNGLNICQTNKTSDYYQADEDWWKEGYREGLGQAGFGSIEFDKSAGMEAIPLHIPIYDPQTHQVLGLAKGVLNLTRVLAEL